MKKLLLTCFAATLALAACGEEDAPKKEEKKSAEVTTEKPTTEKATTEKATTEKATTEEVTTEEPTTEAAKTESKVSENKVYGSVGKGFKKDGVFFWNENKTIMYMGEEDDIYQAERMLDRKLGITVETDLPFLKEHAFDFMENDATEIQKKSDNEFVYESKKANKKYDVIYSRPDGKIVERVIVGQHD